MTEGKAGWPLRMLEDIFTCP
uniref:Uncharacterized protein n=1 Tax=Anguilla anguilla TaxID=7936 RepID=A0A0E9PPJ7_ANGAN